MRQSGYTLLELLLVITLLAVISSYAIMTYRNTAENNRIDQAAIEMQHVLEAALAYNVAHNGKWPENNLPPNCSFDANHDFVKGFLPNAQYTSPYGNNYCWASVDNKTDGPLFWVALKIPFADVARNQSIAQRMASRLPNAITLTNPTDTTPTACDTTSNCYVRAEVAIPAASSAIARDGQLVGLGYCDPSKGNTPQLGSNAAINCTQNSPGDHYTIEFDCPSGNVGQIYLVPNFYTAAALPEDDPPTILTVLRATSNYDAKDPKNNSCQETPADSSHYQCPITITALYDSGTHPVASPNHGSAGAIGATYLAYCLKPNNSKKITRW